VLCLRPEADFARVDALPPRGLNVIYRAPDDPALGDLIKTAAALVIPAVGPNLQANWFETPLLRLVQVTGAGVDRLDRMSLEKLRIPVANIPGGSSSAVAEYAVTAASLLLRRFAWADGKIKSRRYAASRRSMLPENLWGLEGLLVGVIGFGTIGRAVAQAFRSLGCHIAYFDPAVDPKPGRSDRRIAYTARRVTVRGRRRHATRAAPGGNAQSYWSTRAHPNETERSADSGLARRHSG
jgi:phosphoglycerate dehydrogenase-like enzyme